ncbi:MAG: Ig-like domain-containing protein [Candidatus Dormibacteraeota bacterium]|nr:Ig-like domain-containing protein [Candidatus Dormibacteraeota bacterium]
MPEVLRSRQLRGSAAMFVAAVVCVFGLLAGTRQAFAYPPAGPGVTISAASISVPCGHSTTVTATVTGPTGAPDAGVTVVFSVNGGGTLSPISAITDQNGVAVTTFTAATGTTATITVTVPQFNISASTTVTITCSGVQGITTGSISGNGIGLPHTAGSPDRGLPAWALATLLTSIAVLTLAVGFLRLTARRR